MQLRLRPPKGPGELAMPVFMPALRGLGDSKWNRARPLPFLTRSCGSVLRKIRSCRASSWWSEGDGVVPTGRTRLVEMKCLKRGVGEAPKGACGRQAGCGGRRVLLALCPLLLWGTCPRFPQTKHPEALVYGRGMRVDPAEASGCRHGRPAAAAKGARGACDCSPRPPWNSRTPPNAVPWFGSEEDTILSGQLLVVRRRRGASN